MWNLVRGLRERGVTIILTTHYIQEAEEMADRIGVINHGELILVEDKTALMDKLGRRYLTLELQQPLAALPPELQGLQLELKADGRQLEYCFDAKRDANIPELLQRLAALGISFTDLTTRESSLEEIFVSLVHAD
jgi:ABC-2 type transport system ATP-binding protein